MASTQASLQQYRLANGVDIGIVNASPFALQQ